MHGLLRSVSYFLRHIKARGTDDGTVLLKSDLPDCKIFTIQHCLSIVAAGQTAYSVNMRAVLQKNSCDKQLESKLTRAVKM